MPDWPMVRLEELAASERSSISKPYGSAFTAKDYVESGIPMVRGANLGTGKFIDENFVYISESKADKAPGANLQGGDLVFTHRGVIGQVAMVPRSPRFPRYIVSTSQVKARLDSNIALPEFYLYWFLSPAGQRALLSGISTVGVPGLAQPVATIKAIRVPHPPLAVQRATAEALGALDERIAANGRIAAVADMLRSALLTDAQQQPSEFVAQPLSQVAEFINGRAFTKGATGNGRMVVRIAEINSGPGPATVYNDIVVDEKHLARPGDVLFSWSGSLTVARWFRPEAIINQHIFKVIPHGDTPKWLAFEAVKSKLADYRAIAADKATTMGHIQRRHLDEEVVMPIPEAIDRLDRQAGSLWQRALVAEQESLTLAALRDSLLPELMSGRMRVKDAEKVVEEAV
ncbi:restriction endonuclease subunit S [Micromonospora sp. NPDC005203]|uniref:restriction endonuclease subunit S n=1 Tax=Micromonospora sp. NPDC005203 TaxID=3364226 RepID=UPI0036C2AA35